MHKVIFWMSIAMSAHLATGCASTGGMRAWPIESDLPMATTRPHLLVGPTQGHVYVVNPTSEPLEVPGTDRQPSIALETRPSDREPWTSVSTPTRGDSRWVLPGGHYWAVKVPRPGSRAGQYRYRVPLLGDRALTVPALGGDGEGPAARTHTARVIAAPSDLPARELGWTH